MVKTTNFPHPNEGFHRSTRLEYVFFQSSDSPNFVTTSNFFREISLPVSREAAFSWHQRDQAFERLKPPWENVSVESRSGGIDGGIVNLVTYVGWVRLRWKAEHSRFVENEQFFDKALSGPFRFWEHMHRFSEGISENDSGNRTILQDEINYRLRGGWLGNQLLGGWVRRKLGKMFDYRHFITRSDLIDHFAYQRISRKTIAVTGSSGLVGRSIVAFLETGGHRVISLSRTSDTRPKSGCWNPKTGEVKFADDLDSVDIFLHLAGYGIAEKRWSASVKHKIRESRTLTTEKLCEFLADRKMVREGFLCASATGFYGDRKDEILDEESSAGTGFLADVSQQWEAAAKKMEEVGVRVVNLRFGVILSQKGGALSKMLLPFTLGIGGRIGSGKQYWSSISLLDAVRAIHYAMMEDGISGPVNVVAPSPVKVGEFAASLGRVLKRPAFFPLPAFAARLALGEMADHLLLASTRAVPKKLQEHGFRFRHESIEDSLRFELGKVLKSEPPNL